MEEDKAALEAKEDSMEDRDKVALMEVKAVSMEDKEVLAVKGIMEARTKEDSEDREASAGKVGSEGKEATAIKEVMEDKVAKAASLGDRDKEDSTEEVMEAILTNSLLIT